MTFEVSDLRDLDRTACGETGAARNPVAAHRPAEL